jgi:hypothetical protein
MSSAEPLPVSAAAPGEKAEGAWRVRRVRHAAAAVAASAAASAAALRCALRCASRAL